MSNDDDTDTVAETPSIPDEVDDVSLSVEALSLNSRPSDLHPRFRTHLGTRSGVPLSRVPFEVEVVDSDTTLLRCSTKHKAIVREDSIASSSSSSSDTSESSEVSLSDPASPLASDSPRRSGLLPIQPEWILEAPRIADDFYYNLLSWSSQDVLGVALDTTAYLWNAQTEETLVLHIKHKRISSLEFSLNGSILALGTETGSIELWDVETQSILRTIGDCTSYSDVTCLSWNHHILSSGSQDTRLWNLDVRLSKSKVMELRGQQSGLCGLKWNESGTLLASGDSNGVLSIWDVRSKLNVLGPRTQAPKWQNNQEHLASVKALAWCPWQPSLLASGGGISDGSVIFWDATTGEKRHSFRLGQSTQVTSIQWSPNGKDFMATLGYDGNGMVLFRYPTMEPILDCKHSHDNRVLWSALNPSREVVCTGGADGILKFWRIWDKVRIV
ncbi:hypothetical protein NLI96_g7352 [Meripilus lineatus]|uniref:CDC20/Fizzy WD40 domain-containing protein n=1 Tax=Meripilus lineatus TaxID=2056292 RepID=A0AAD5V4K7_9APHY|nr:hypothetical protein NLI96_g7352 [Physisporinus lineatus]